MFYKLFDLFLLIAKRHKNGHKYCCFKLAQHNVPGVIHSSCRKDTLLTEIVDIESVKKGNIKI